MRPRAYNKPAGYSFMDALFASPTEPMPVETQNLYFELILSALEEIEGDLSIPHWNALSEMVNIMQTLVIHGFCEDTEGLVEDAIAALASAGRCHLQGIALRVGLSEQNSVRAIAADFMDIVKAIPHRDMVRLHRATQVRIQNYRNKRDVEIIDLVKKKAAHAAL